MNKVIKFFYHLVTILWLGIIIIPFVPVIIGAFKGSEEYYSTAPYHLATNPTGANFIDVLTNNELLTSLFNTVLLIAVSIVITSLLSSMVAYALERFNFKYKKLVTVVFVIISFFPMTVMQVSVFRVMTITHLNNTFLGLGLLYSVSDIVIIYLFRDNIRKLSTNIDASARVMGASYWQVYWKLIFPNLRPTIMIVCIYKIINIYNDFYLQSLYLTKHKTISTFLYQYTSPYQLLWPQICATIVVLAVIAMVGLAVIQIYYQKKYNRRAI